MENIYKIALIVVLIIVIWRIYIIFDQSNTEHMIGNMNAHQYVNYTKDINGPKEIKFYYRPDRYAEPNNITPELIDPLSGSDSQLSCVKNNNQNINLTPGANNTYSDILWHVASPKMILESDALNCGPNNGQSPIGTFDSSNDNYYMVTEFENGNSPQYVSALDEMKQQELLIRQNPNRIIF